jgi:hypothetical protein
MWCAVALDEARRFNDAVDAYHSAFAETSLSHSLARMPADAPHRESWQEHIDAYAGHNPLTFARMAEVAGHRYFFVLAVAQVRKCVNLLEDDELPQMSDPKVVKLLRDIDEHWEQDKTHTRAHSLREMLASEPDARPGKFIPDHKRGHWLSDTVNADHLVNWVIQVDSAVRSAAMADGDPLFDLDDPVYPLPSGPHE